MRIRPYEPADRDAVIALWTEVFGYPEARNDPARVLDNKLALADDLILVAIADGVLIGTLMGGYDGHRGWLHRAAVAPSARRTGVGTALVRAIEAALQARGCAKINVQTHAHNQAAATFWRQCGYAVEARISFGKELPNPGGATPT